MRANSVSLSAARALDEASVITVLKKPPRKPYPKGDKLLCSNCNAFLNVPAKAIRDKRDSEPDGNTGQCYWNRVYTCPHCQQEVVL